MAQKSIPLMNKAGYSMYWNNMWDDKVNYSKNLNKNIFFNDIFDIILKNNNSYNYNNYNYNYFRLSKIFFFFFNKSLNKNNLKPNKITKHNYNSKIWLLKLNNWVIIYSFIINSFFKKNYKILFKKNKKVFDTFVYKNKLNKINFLNF